MSAKVNSEFAKLAGVSTSDPELREKEKPKKKNKTSQKIPESLPKESQVANEDKLEGIPKYTNSVKDVTVPKVVTSRGKKAKSGDNKIPTKSKKKKTMVMRIKSEDVELPEEPKISKAQQTREHYDICKKFVNVLHLARKQGEELYSTDITSSIEDLQGICFSVDYSEMEGACKSLSNKIMRIINKERYEDAGVTEDYDSGVAEDAKFYLDNLKGIVEYTAKSKTAWNLNKSEDTNLQDSKNEESQAILTKQVPFEDRQIVLDGYSVEQTPKDEPQAEVQPQEVQVPQEVLTKIESPDERQISMDDSMPKEPSKTNPKPVSVNPFEHVDTGYHPVHKGLPSFSKEFSHIVDSSIRSFNPKFASLTPQALYCYVQYEGTHVISEVQDELANRGIRYTDLDIYARASKSDITDCGEIAFKTIRTNLRKLEESRATKTTETKPEPKSESIETKPEPKSDAKLDLQKVINDIDTLDKYKEFGKLILQITSWDEKMAENLLHLMVPAEARIWDKQGYKPPLLKFLEEAIAAVKVDGYTQKYESKFADIIVAYEWAITNWCTKEQIREKERDFIHERHQTFSVYNLHISNALKD